MQNKIGVFGAFGKMGTQVRKVIESDQNILPSGYYGRGGNLESYKISSISELIELSDVLIDFSLPELMQKVILELLKNSKPLISGTTGHDNFAQLKLLSQFVPVVWSANMSIGINLLLNFIKGQFKNLKDFDISIFESHHKSKKDSPSGTAISIKETINLNLPTKNIDIFSLRAGEIFGEHSVTFVDKDQIIKLQHTALNRRLFAEGAVFAAKKKV